MKQCPNCGFGDSPYRENAANTPETALPKRSTKNRIIMKLFMQNKLKNSKGAMGYGIGLISTLAILFVPTFGIYFIGLFNPLIKPYDGANFINVWAGGMLCLIAIFMACVALYFIHEMASYIGRKILRK